MNISLSESSITKLDDIRHHEEEQLVAILAQKYGLPYINLGQVAINTDALRLVPEKVAREAEVAPFQISGKKVSIGIRTPNNPPGQAVLRDLENRGYKPVPHMTSQMSLQHVWNYYKETSFAVETEAGVLDVSNDEIRALIEKLTSLSATRDAITEVLGMKKIYRITRTLEVILAGALANHASDIHIEPEEEMVRIRLRLDGVLVDIAHIDAETYRSVLTRVKLLSGLKINVKSSAQDGRFSVRIDDREIEIRTSILPGGNGESIVMRLLDPHSIGHTLETLGMRPSVLEVLTRELKKPNGMILTTGPTGSGKTTTLYAFLKSILDPGIKILTIEDPIEYHLEGIVQTQVNHKDYTFATGLRSALRQDPDVIMVGEIRDDEVASTALHAALTGHLVFSTLHTNNAAGAYPRLIDMGIEPSMIGSAVNLVMAQRLLRVLRKDQCVEVEITGEDKIFVDRVLAGIENKALIPENTTRMWVPNVSEGETGYRGRIGVYEVIETTREIENAVREKHTTRELEDIAHTQEHLSLHEDGILKVLEGITTLEEVRRILGEHT